MRWAALRADAGLCEAEIALAEAIEQACEATATITISFTPAEFYLERYPDRAQRLFHHVRRWTITLNPLFNTCLTCYQPGGTDSPLVSGWSIGQATWISLGLHRPAENADRLLGHGDGSRQPRRQPLGQVHPVVRASLERWLC